MKIRVLLLAALLCSLQASAMEPIQLSHPITAEENAKNTAERNAIAKQNQEVQNNIWADQGALTNLAKSCPGVGDAVTVIDNSHVGVTISPGPYATTGDIVYAVSMVIAGYIGFIHNSPNYNGYLRVGIAEKLDDGKYHVTQIFEATSGNARAVWGDEDAILNYINSVLRNDKSYSYAWYDAYGRVDSDVMYEGTRYSKVM